MNSRLLTILRALITGESTTEFEQILGDSLGVVRKHRHNQTVRDRSRLSLFSIGGNTGPFQYMKVLERFYGYKEAYPYKYIIYICAI